MAEYGAVPPPVATPEQDAKIQEALARAKQIAAKLSGGAPAAPAAATAAPVPPPTATLGAGIDEPRKRSAEEAGFENGGDVIKKPTTPMTGDPKQVAMQVAANITQRAGLGSMVVEDIKIPSKFVGLIIGRGGEMINKLQSETSARIQVAPDPVPGQLVPPDRNITITGAPGAVEGAKKLVNQICEEGKVPDHLMGAPNQPGEFAVEHMIPASKVGLIIGKGGETIRNLQERAGCRMVMIQDGPYQNAPEKPLRITGDPQKCQYGKQLVLDLLTEKELEGKPGMDFKNRGQNQNFGGGKGAVSTEVPVPREIVGFVIGKGGDTIKRIQAETGCRVQFTMPDTGGQDRMCSLQGDPQQINEATQKIREIIDTSRSRGPPTNRPPPNAPGVRTVEQPVPANKCGIVIGKGGESIRQINQMSGAHVEINKATTGNTDFKHFVIRGNDGQIQHAQRLISEKCGLDVTQFLNQQGQQPGMQNQQQQQQQPWGYPGYNAYGQQPPPQQYGQPPQQSYGQPPQAWAQYGQQYGQQAPQQQMNPQAAAAQPQQDYTAAWAAYYQQYYNQYGVAASGAPTAGTQVAPAPAQQPAVSNAQPVAGQQDYSAAWAAYYQQMYPGYQAQQQQQQPGQQQPAAQ